MDGHDIVKILEENRNNQAVYSSFRNINPQALRIVFLDIDGVLNSVSTYVVHGAYPNTNDNWTLGSKYIEKGHCFDNICIQLVNKLCKYTGSLIVVSSSWRNSFNLRHTIEMFSEMGISPEYVVGRTDEYGDNRFRGLQIERFINRLQQGPSEVKKLVEDSLLTRDFLDIKEPIILENYVILDDLDDHYVMLDTQSAYLIHTDNLEGLTLRNTVLAGQILTDNEHFNTKSLQGKSRPNTLW
jgi:hypothetical protein